MQWWRDAVFYQVYVPSFTDSDGDGLGDLQGVRSRLGYLELLGVDALWLSPIYPSPMVDNGYDITDHRAVDRVWGDLDDVDELVADAHAHGIRVTVDLVPNHTSDQHPWFRAALASPPGRKWYRARSGLPGGDASAARNHGCRSEVWLGTRSTVTRMPCACASATSSSTASRSPQTGSTARWSVMS